MIMTKVIVCIAGLYLFSMILGGFFQEEETVNPVRECVEGLFLMMAVLAITSLFCIFQRKSLKMLVFMTAAIFAVFTVLSVIRNGKRWIQAIKQIQIRKPDWLFLVLIALIVFQTLMLGIGTHMDDDDAFYVATATTSVDTDTLYQFEPYTGDAYYRFPARYVLSPFPMLAAVISRFTGVRPAVVCHTVYPFFFIPLAYFVYALLAEKLFDGKKEEKRLFLIGVSLIQLYSGFSSLTAGKFLLIRIWQGKAILAAVILPYLLYFALEYGSREYLKLREWLLLACVMVAGCFVSSMGIMLAAIEVGVLSLVCVIRYKNIRLLLQVALSNGLNLLLAGIYLYMR